jgi:homoserine acetyltransferase
MKPDLGPTKLSRGVMVPSLHLAYKVYGELNAQNNLILTRTSYGSAAFRRRLADRFDHPDLERYCT